MATGTDAAELRISTGTEAQWIPIPTAIPIPRGKPSATSRPGPAPTDEEPARATLGARVGIGIAIGIGIDIDNSRGRPGSILMLFYRRVQAFVMVSFMKRRAPPAAPLSDPGSTPETGWVGSGQ